MLNVLLEEKDKGLCATLILLNKFLVSSLITIFSISKLSDFTLTFFFLFISSWISLSLFFFLISAFSGSKTKSNIYFYKLYGFLISFLYSLIYLLKVLFCFRAVLILPVIIVLLADIVPNSNSLLPARIYLVCFLRSWTSTGYIIFHCLFKYYICV